MTDVFMTLKFGHAHFSYSLYFTLYLLIGWATIVLHARQNFDQPTYDLTQNEPTYIMVPRFFSSQHLYLRGFLIYLTGMTGILPRPELGRAGDRSRYRGGIRQAGNQNHGCRHR